jgi:F0F1-type ATP synthase alpha subunit
LLLFAVAEGFADEIPVEKIGTYEQTLYASFEEKHSDLVERLRSGAKADEAMLNALRAALSAEA